MVTWSAAARRDLRHVHDFIARDSPLYARRVIDDLVERSSTLEQFPSRGRVAPELGDESVREVFVHSYRMIYELKGEDVVVLAVIHGRRQLPEVR